MNSKYIILILSVLVIFTIWSCKEEPQGPQGNGLTKTVLIAGNVIDLSTTNTIFSARVLLSTSSRTDSVLTTADGKFQFAVELPDGQSVNAVLTVRKTGYIQKSVNLTVFGDTTVSIAIDVDRSTYSTVTGRIRDFNTSYPLRNTSVVLSIPGFIDSVTTSTDGLYRFAIDLVDIDSLPVSLTYRKDGYQAQQHGLYAHRGQMTLSDVMLRLDVGSTIAQISGRVFDRQSNVTLNNAIVSISSSVITDSVFTASDGSYLFSLNLTGLSSASGSVTVRKSGYKSSSYSFTVLTGMTYSQDVRLDRDTTTSIRDSSATGVAHAIALVTLSRNQISVYGVGGIESAIITWEVRDSLGFPIDYDHRDTVTFNLIGTPVIGGAYVSPARAVTNSSGRVSTTINSGTVSGTLQFVAKLRRESDGVVIQSMPAVITVNAGLPHQAHFSVGPAQFNFAGFDWIGRTDQISVQVGDKYSNPVRAGTAVYFNTSGGVIEASGFTDASGHASVTLYSGNPLPYDGTPNLGWGYSRVRAFTQGENGDLVWDSIWVLFSGRPANIDIMNTYSVRGFPDIFSLGAGQCDSLLVTIKDHNNNPLAPGTTITTELKYGRTDSSLVFVVNGLPVDPLDDYLYRGPGRTEFNVAICDLTPATSRPASPQMVTLTIRVNGPNGTVVKSIGGYWRP